MELARGLGAKTENKMKHLNVGRTGMNSDTLMVIQLPDSRVLRILSRSVFLALVILTLPYVVSIIRERSEANSGSDATNSNLFTSVFRDLASEGLLRKSDKALIVCPGIAGMIHNLQQHFHNGVIDVVMDSDLKGQNSISEETFDFVFTSGIVDTKFVDRVVKTGGIVAVPLSSNPKTGFRKQSNYRIVYLRRYDSTIMALRKVGPSNEQVESSTRRRLCQMASEAKKAKLESLEDVLLEPPRRALMKSTNYLKKIRFLSDLLGDTLEDYKRRVFIGVGLAEENIGVTEWFRQNYPKRNQEFEVYNLDQAVPEEGLGRVAVSSVEVSDWLVKNVKEEEYVVLKAEAEVVEEMIKRRSICLVDELFLECKNHWWKGGERDKGKRAYWECLALHGRLRDEGVAVHQWWG